MAGLATLSSGNSRWRVISAGFDVDERIKTSRPGFTQIAGLKKDHFRARNPPSADQANE